MKKVLTALLVVIVIASCNKAKEVENTSSSKHVNWELDTATYDAEQVGEVEEDSVYDSPTEWIWDGSQFDTLRPGTTLRISNIDGDKVYLVMSN